MPINVDLKWTRSRSSATDLLRARPRVMGFKGGSISSHGSGYLLLFAGEPSPFATYGMNHVLSSSRLLLIQVLHCRPAFQKPEILASPSTSKHSSAGTSKPNLVVSWSMEPSGEELLYPSSTRHLIVVQTTQLEP